MVGKIFLIVCVIAIFTFNSGFGQQLGDVNNNGSIDIVDALMIAQYYVGIYSPNFYLALADVNCDGPADIVDALIVAQYYVGLLSKLPCAPNPTAVPTAIPTVAPTAVPTAAPSISPTAVPGEGAVNVIISSSTIIVGGYLSTQILVSTGEKVLKDFSFDILYSWSAIMPNTLVGNNGIIPALDVSISSYTTTSTVDGTGRLTISGISNGIFSGANIQLFTIYWTAVGQSPANELQICTNSLKDSNNAVMQQYPCIQLPIPVIAPTSVPTAVPTPVPTAGPTSAPNIGAVWIATNNPTVYTGQYLLTYIYITTGDKKVATYDFTVTYDSSAIKIAPAIFGGADIGGVWPCSPFGFISSVDSGTPGTIRIIGSNLSGSGPATNNVFLEICWFALSAKTTAITLTPNIFSDTNGNPIGSPTTNSIKITISQSIPADVSKVKLKASYLCTDPSGQTNSIKPVIYISDQSTVLPPEMIPYELIKFRYYYTNDGATAETISLSYHGETAQSSIISNLYPGYLEVGFAPNSGIMFPAGDWSDYFKLNIKRADNALYDQTDDWSFNPRINTYTDWDHVTVYYNGTLIWGSEPPPAGAPTPTPVPVTNLSCTVNFPANFSNTANHWILNTGTPLDSIAIQLSATGADTTPVALTGTLADIVLLPPIDPTWDPEDVDATNPALHPNIHRNQGTCPYTLYCHTAGASDYRAIAYFYRNIQATGEDDSFTLNPGDILNSGYRVDGLGNLYYYVGNTIYTRFAIGISNGPGTIRPGDDMILRFALADDPRVVTAKADGNFMAVYDFKMMWRAESYINEEVNDWNNLHPWTAAQGNAWDVSTFGIQTAIASYTRYWDNAVISNAVCYSWGCSDSPMDFNTDMDRQKISIAAYYAANPNAQHPEFGAWNLTTAPNNSYGFSNDQNDANDMNNFLINYRFGTPVVGSNAFDPLKINGVDFYPYAPGFSSMLRYGFTDANEININKYSSIHTMYSAGADCSGFVQRSASYAGNHYDDYDGNADDDAMNNLPEQRLEWGTVWPGSPLEGCSGFINDSWVICGYDNSTNPVFNNSININLLIPGDIIVINDSVNGWHMGIVDRIIYTNGRTTDSKNVYIIEEAGASLSVRKSQSWQNFIDNANITCTIRRLKYF